MFSNLTNGSTVYVLQTNNGLKYDVCTVEALKPSFSYNFNNGAIVDIAVTIDGQRKEFSGIQANSSVSTSNNYIITDSREAMVNQIQNRYQSDIDVIEKYDYYKTDAEQCKDLLGKLNPQFAKEQAMDTALTGLSQRVDEIQGEFGDLKMDMKRILKLLTDKNTQL